MNKLPCDAGCGISEKEKVILVVKRRGRGNKVDGVTSL